MLSTAGLHGVGEVAEDQIVVRIEANDLAANAHVPDLPRFLERSGYEFAKRSVPQRSRGSIDEIF